MSTIDDDCSPSPSEAGLQSKTVQKHPCVLCQQRKVKCDRNDPCQNCTRACVECIPASTLPPRKRKKRFAEAELLARLRKYEVHLKNYGADIDAINREEAPPPIKSPSEIKAQAGQFEFERALCNRSLAVKRSLRHVESNIWTGPNDPFRAVEEILGGSSDEEDGPLTKTYDNLVPDGGELLFPSTPMESLGDLHPPPMHIFRLWQAFLDNVNPLTKIIHAPTVQQLILDASADLGKISKRTEVLMFGIYATAVQSLSEDEARSTFGEERATLLERYQIGCRQALRRASILRSSDTKVLQGFTLYLISCMNFSIDPRALYCMTGMAVRIAQRMGLLNDGTAYGIPPFETEMRRRLWWQILIIDNRVGEMSGAGPTHHTHIWTTKLPSNVNDSSLFKDMGSPPVEHPAATEMIYVLQKYETIQFMHHAKRLSGPRDIKTTTIDEFETMMENKYLKYCDTQVPLHNLSLMMAKSAISKLRMGPRHPALLARGGNEGEVISKEEQEKLFIWGVTMLEYHQLMMSTKSLNRFLWQISTNAPFPGQIYILSSLRHRTTGELADRAWNVLQATYERRGHSDFAKQARKKSHSALHLALNGLVVRAWDARQAALPGLQTPEFILKLKREQAEKKASPGSSTVQSEASPPELANGLGGGYGGNQFADHPWLMGQPPMGAGMSFDQSLMMIPGDPQLMQSMDWSLWNGFMQPGSAGFDGGMGNGFLPT